MISNKRAIILILGLALLVTSGSALRCWVCSSNVNAMCADPMNTSDHQAAFHVRTCEAGQYGTTRPICRKIVKREFGERVVIRQCSTPYHDEMDITSGVCSATAQPGRDVVESCHICSTDLCNSATDVPTMRLLYAGGLALFVYVFYQSKRCAL